MVTGLAKCDDHANTELRRTQNHDWSHLNDTRGARPRQGPYFLTFPGVRVTSVEHSSMRLIDLIGIYDGVTAEFTFKNSKGEFKQPYTHKTS